MSPVRYFNLIMYGPWSQGETNSVSSLPAAPPLWQEVVGLLEHLRVTVDAVADVDCTVALWDVKPCEGGVLCTREREGEKVTSHF